MSASRRADASRQWRLSESLEYGMVGINQVCCLPSFFSYCALAVLMSLVHAERFVVCGVVLLA
jgi:hypothetical protein